MHAKSGGCLVIDVQRSLCNGPGIRLEGRVRSAEIFRSRYLGAVRNIQEPSTLDGDLSIPISRMRILESRVRSTETEYFRSRDLW